MNILGIIDYNGNVVVKYDCSVYGEEISCTDNSGIGLGKLNKFKYKGYYYIDEISLFYVTSRFYDPKIGRFISPDSTKYLSPYDLNGLDLFDYCFNDPVNNVDPSGCEPFNWGWLIAGLGVAVFIGLTIASFGLAPVVASAYWATTLMVVGVTGLVSAAAGAFFGGITSAMNGGDILFGIVNGAWSYGIMGWGAAFSPLGGFASGFLAGGFAEFGSQLYKEATIENYEVDYYSVISEATIWGITNGLAGGLTKGLDILFKGICQLTQMELILLNSFFIPTFDGLGLLFDSLLEKIKSKREIFKINFLGESI